MGAKVPSEQQKHTCLILFATQHVGYDRFLPPSLGGETCCKRKRPLRMLALDNLSVILMSLICMSQRFSSLKAHNVTLSF